MAAFKPIITFSLVSLAFKSSNKIHFSWLKVKEVYIYIYLCVLAAESYLDMFRKIPDDF